MTDSGVHAASNPLLTRWDSPFGLPPFHLIAPAHFQPAVALGCAEHLAEIDAIASSGDAPNFENTLVALDASGALLKRTRLVFENLCASESSPALQQAELTLMPLLAAHDCAVYMHAAMFARIRAVHECVDRSQLSVEQQRLLDRITLDFQRSGATLTGTQQVRYAAIMQRLAALGAQFGQNVLADEVDYALHLHDDADLAGLPDFVRAAARQAAIERGLSSGHVVTLARAHVLPFLTFSERRDLREQICKAWAQRGDAEAGSGHGNAEIAREMLQLRLEQAQLHGFSSYAEYATADRMARTPEAVDQLLAQVWQPACMRARAEYEELQAHALSCGASAVIAPWDWRFYAEQVRKLRFDIDEAQIKPFFVLDNMVEALFECAARLFGLHFEFLPEVRAYHPDVKAYRVTHATGEAVGIFLHDNFARPTKRGGAWMSAFRWQSKLAGRVLPIIVNNNNFAKGAAGEPTLLSFDDARTLFHEFGHGLHGLLSNVTYERLSGTNVLQDFVELPSQLFEHWLSEPEVLARHARHFQTGAAISGELMTRLLQARKFNQGYETVQYLSSALVDMAVHRLASARELQALNINACERGILQGLGMPEAVTMNHRLTHFRHLFSGDSYAAGYYVYLWAEVLDADAFGAFTEAGDPFDRAVADRLCQYIYSSGNTIEPGAAYVAFRGRPAVPQAMLRKRGLFLEETQS